MKLLLVFSTVLLFNSNSYSHSIGIVPVNPINCAQRSASKVATGNIHSVTRESSTVVVKVRLRYGSCKNGKFQPNSNWSNSRFKLINIGHQVGRPFPELSIKTATSAKHAILTFTFDERDIYTERVVRIKHSKVGFLNQIFSYYRFDLSIWDHHGTLKYSLNKKKEKKRVTWLPPKTE